MAKHKTIIKRRGRHCGSLLKRQIISEYLSGDQTQATIAARYGFSERSIYQWVKDHLASESEKAANFNGMTEAEQKRYDLLEQQNAELKKQLEFASMQVHAMDVLMDLAKQEYGIDIRKNSGAKQSVKSKKATRRQK